MIKRLLAVLHARNLEFVRDRGTLLFTPSCCPSCWWWAWDSCSAARNGRCSRSGVRDAPDRPRRPMPSCSERYVEFVAEPDEASGHAQGHSPADRPAASSLGPPLRYWVNTDSPKGYIVEKLLLAAGPAGPPAGGRGAAVRYVDWLFPGILGMNMMFSCLFGVGYVVVRYRKSGFLKRLHATPLTALRVPERPGALAPGSDSLRDRDPLRRHRHDHRISQRRQHGAAAAGGGPQCALSMVALGLTIAARFSSEELVGGLLNVLTWPMMLLSGIWFSLEGSPRWVQWIAHVFPLTHALDAARAVMLDGAGIRQIAPDLLYLAAHRAGLPRLRGLVVPLAHRLTRLQEPSLAVPKRQYLHRLPRDPGDALASVNRGRGPQPTATTMDGASRSLLRRFLRYRGARLRASLPERRRTR